jgi:ABC-type transport system involved in Fe-S cluster assembly fused permease/ATPase subunit
MAITREGRPLLDAGVLGVAQEHRRRTVAQTHEQLALGGGNVVERAEHLQVSRADVGEDADIGPGQ